MIRSLSEKYLISSIGWVDKSSLWVFDTESETTENINLGECEYLSTHEGIGNHFSVLQHQRDRTYPVLSAHSAEDPTETLGNILLGEDSRIEGDSEVWRYLSRAYVDYFQHRGQADYWLILIDPVNRRVTYQNFNWFDDSYDKGYQGVIAATEIPGSDLLLISVQRSSDLVLYNPWKGKLVRKIPLANRGGNPIPRFRQNANELWSDDYDALIKLNPEDWSLIGSRILQEPEGNMHQFIGEFAFDQDESLCVVARPFSGDVLGLDMRTLKTRYRCKTGGQPLRVSVLEDKRVFARDWQTGRLLKGSLKKESWFSW